jgi:hypothetical protein
MITAWSPSRMVRARSAGPVLRVLALAVLLFGIVVTHGVHAESVSGHLSVSATTPAALSDDDVRPAAAEPPPLVAGDVEDHGGHVPSHPGEQCASGQPQQGSGLVSPFCSASVRGPGSADNASTARVPGAVGPRGGASPAALRAASVVRQV